MKRTFIVFVALLTLFIGIWTVKAQSVAALPENNPGYASGVWSGYDARLEVSPEWILDPEIPENYLPVPGRNELYMVIDDSGNITCYRQRTQQPDGSWLWADVNPDIPDHYEAVPGVKDVYKVIGADGIISYFQYIRNADDTFAFVPVDMDGRPLAAVPKGDEIPENYHRITGNIYAVLNEHGVIIGYKERRSNADGTFGWVDCEKPVIKQDDPGGVIPGTKPNNPGGNGKQTLPPGNPQNPYIPGTTGTPGGNSMPTLPPGNPLTALVPAATPRSQGPDIPLPVVTPGTIVAPQSDGTYIETETLISTETSGGWTTTYQTVIIRIYTERGVLLSTRKEGPTIISQVRAGDTGPNAPDPSKIAKTIGEELARVSAGMNYKADLARDVLNELNAERAAEGLPALQMDTNSNAYKVAQIYAADMATYDHGDFDSPLYGSLSNLLNRFGLSSPAPSQNIWKTTTSKTAGAIHSRFMTLDGARQARMSRNYTNVGIAVVQRNGYMYVCEIFLN